MDFFSLGCSDAQKDRVPAASSPEGSHHEEHREDAWRGPGRSPRSKYTCFLLGLHTLWNPFCLVANHWCDMSDHWCIRPLIYTGRYMGMPRKLPLLWLWAGQKGCLAHFVLRKSCCIFNISFNWNLLGYSIGAQDINTSEHFLNKCFLRFQINN